MASPREIAAKHLALAKEVLLQRLHISHPEIDIDPVVLAVLLWRIEYQDRLVANLSSELKKSCSAGCGATKIRADFSKKQWSGRAVRRCLKCVDGNVAAKLCAHRKGAYDCAVCIAMVQCEVDAEAAEAAAAKYRYDRTHEAENEEGVSAHVELACNRVYMGTRLVRDVVVTIAAADVTLDFGDWQWSVKSMDIGIVRWYHDDAFGIGRDDYFAMQLEPLDPDTKWERPQQPAFCGFNPANERHQYIIVCVLEGDAVARFKEDAMTIMQGGPGSHKGWATAHLAPITTRAMAMLYLQGAFAASCANCFCPPDPSSVCTDCKCMHYCSKECQRADWKTHMVFYQKLAAALAGEDWEGNALEASANAAADAGIEDSPIIPKLKTAIAEYAKWTYNATHPWFIDIFLHDPVGSTPEESMLDSIESACLDRPEGGRVNLIRRFREALVIHDRKHQMDLANEEEERIRKLLSTVATEGPDAVVPLDYEKLMHDAEEEHLRKRRRDRQVERRKCDVCSREDPVSSPRFMTCAGCKKRRYCSEACQKKDWVENGHKATCAPISDFECRVTPGCPISERSYCGHCADTFCTDCEGDVPVRCDDCGMYSCGSMRGHSYGPFDGVCPGVFMCDLCQGVYCTSCRIAFRCDNCRDVICIKCAGLREGPTVCRRCAPSNAPRDAGGRAILSPGKNWRVIRGNWVRRSGVAEPVDRQTKSKL